MPSNNHFDNWEITRSNFELEISKFPINYPLNNLQLKNRLSFDKQKFVSTQGTPYVKMKISRIYILKIRTKRDWWITLYITIN